MLSIKALFCTKAVPLSLLYGLIKHYSLLICWLAGASIGDRLWNRIAGYLRISWALTLDFPECILWNILKARCVMIKREAYDALMRLAAQFPVVAITGPR